LTHNFDQALHTFFARSTCRAGVTSILIKMMILPISWVPKALVVPFIALAIYGMYSCVRDFSRSLLPNPTPQELLPYYHSSGLQSLKLFPEFLRQLSKHKIYLASGVVIFMIAEAGMVWMFFLVLTSLKIVN